MKYLVVKECVLDGKRAFIFVSMASTPEQGIEQLSEAMSCKWGPEHETFALLKVEIDGITTIFPPDIPLYKKERKKK